MRQLQLADGSTLSLTAHHLLKAAECAECDYRWISAGDVQPQRHWVLSHLKPQLVVASTQLFVPVRYVLTRGDTIVVNNVLGSVHVLHRQLFSWLTLPLRWLPLRSPIAGETSPNTIIELLGPKYAAAGGVGAAVRTKSNPQTEHRIQLVWGLLGGARISVAAKSTSKWDGWGS